MGLLERVQTDLKAAMRERGKLRFWSFGRMRYFLSTISLVTKSLEGSRLTWPISTSGLSRQARM